MMKFSLKLPLLILLGDLPKLLKTVHEFTWIPRERNVSCVYCFQMYLLLRQEECLGLNMDILL